MDALNLAIGQLAGESVEGFLGFLTFSPAEVSYYIVGLVVAGCYFALQTHRSSTILYSGLGAYEAQAWDF